MHPGFSRWNLAQVSYEAIGTVNRYVIEIEAGIPVTADWVEIRFSFPLSSQYQETPSGHSQAHG